MPLFPTSNYSKNSSESRACEGYAMTLDIGLWTFDL
jgi:hypothetical protein